MPTYINDLTRGLIFFLILCQHYQLTSKVLIFFSCFSLLVYNFSLSWPSFLYLNYQRTFCFFLLEGFLLILCALLPPVPAWMKLFLTVGDQKYIHYFWWHFTLALYNVIDSCLSPLKMLQKILCRITWIFFMVILFWWLSMMCRDRFSSSVISKWRIPDLLKKNVVINS